MKTKKKFNSSELRKWAKQIEDLKNQIEKMLTNPMQGRTQFHLPKWNKMNSQQKKIFVFRAIELGFINLKFEKHELA